MAFPRIYVEDDDEDKDGPDDPPALLDRLKQEFMETYEDEAGEALKDGLNELIEKLLQAFHLDLSFNPIVEVKESVSANGMKLVWVRRVDSPEWLLLNPPLLDQETPGVA